LTTFSGLCKKKLRNSCITRTTPKNKERINKIKKKKKKKWESVIVFILFWVLVQITYLVHHLHGNLINIGQDQVNLIHHLSVKPLTRGTTTTPGARRGTVGKSI
jgi:ABC-type phosphate/phosphonate transport system permease subunit